MSLRNESAATFLTDQNNSAASRKDVTIMAIVTQPPLRRTDNLVRRYLMTDRIVRPTPSDALGLPVQLSDGSGGTCSRSTSGAMISRPIRWVTVFQIVS